MTNFCNIFVTGNFLSLIMMMMMMEELKKFYLTSKTWMKVSNSIPILDFLLIALQMFNNILLLYFVSPLNCFFFQSLQLVNKISTF